MSYKRGRFQWVCSSGDAREVYFVEADTEEEAMAIFERGEAEHVLTEVEGCTFHSIKKERD